jgi:hypothetical protein
MNATEPTELILTPIIGGHPLHSEAFKAGRIANRIRAIGLDLQRDLLDLFAASAGDFLDGWFESAPIKAAFGFDSVVGNYASPYTPGSAYVLLHHSFGEVNGKNAIDEGFPKASEAYYVPPNPDARYDTLDGVTRLRALEAALSTSRGGWDDDPAKRANDWLRIPGKTALALYDFESTCNAADDFPQVWNRFGWASSPRQPEAAEAPQRDLQVEADRVLALLEMLSENTLSVAIEGVSHWLDAWSKQVVASPRGLPVWQRVWPIAVEATNAKRQGGDDANLSVSARAADDDREPMDLDTLNTPAGKLVGVFLSACPSLTQEPNPIAADSSARQMRHAVIGATGRSGLIARHRLIEALPYFLRADRHWTQEHLITPLLNDDGASLALWRAIARQTHFTEVLKIIGGAMAERATDPLGAIRGEAWCLALSSNPCMHFVRTVNPRFPILVFCKCCDPSTMKFGQRPRTLSSGSLMISRKGRPVKRTRRPVKRTRRPQRTCSRSAAAPFLRDVWPQERSLATPGVSRALSDLPATSDEAFAEAVEAIDRFLVPFECWSMVNYGLYGDDGETKKLTIIDDDTKANALLRLLDLTIGSSDGVVVPHDLTDALDQIQSVAPALVEHPAFRRLSTAARR